LGRVGGTNASRSTAPFPTTCTSPPTAQLLLVGSTDGFPHTPMLLLQEPHTPVALHLLVMPSFPWCAAIPYWSRIGWDTLTSACSETRNQDFLGLGSLGLGFLGLGSWVWSHGGFDAASCTSPQVRLLVCSFGSRERLGVSSSLSAEGQWTRLVALSAGSDMWHRYTHLPCKQGLMQLLKGGRIFR